MRLCYKRAHSSSETPIRNAFLFFALAVHLLDDPMAPARRQSYFTKVMQQESSAEKQLAADLLKAHVGSSMHSCSLEYLSDVMHRAAAAASAQTSATHTPAAEARTVLETRALQRHHGAKCVHVACVKLQACSKDTTSTELLICAADSKSIATACCHEKVKAHAAVLLQRPSATVLEAELAAAQRRVAHKQVLQQRDTVELTARERATELHADRQLSCTELQVSEAVYTHASLRSDGECHRTKGETLAQLRAYAAAKIKRTRPSMPAPKNVVSANTATAVLTVRQRAHDTTSRQYTASHDDAKLH
jgi:hypothetical protein